MFLPFKLTFSEWSNPKAVCVQVRPFRPSPEAIVRSPGIGSHVAGSCAPKSIVIDGQQHGLLTIFALQIYLLKLTTGDLRNVSSFYTTFKFYLQFVLLSNLNKVRTFIA